MNDKTVRRKRNISEQNYRTHDKVLLKKILFTLNDKYRNLIIEKKYNIEWFKERAWKEIQNMIYLDKPNYGKFFMKIERIFLKELTNYSDPQCQGLLAPPEIDYLLNIDYYKYNLHFPLGRVTIRNMVENEKNLEPVDKYLRVQDKKRPQSKVDCKRKYSEKINCNCTKNPESNKYLNKNENTNKNLNPYEYFGYYP